MTRPADRRYPAGKPCGRGFIQASANCSLSRKPLSWCSRSSPSSRVSEAAGPSCRNRASVSDRRSGVQVTAGVVPVSFSAGQRLFRQAEKKGRMLQSPPDVGAGARILPAQVCATTEYACGLSCIFIMMLHNLTLQRPARPPHLHVHPVALHKKPLFAIQDVDGHLVQGVAVQSILHCGTSWSAGSAVGTVSLSFSAAGCCCAKHPAMRTKGIECQNRRHH